MLYKLGVLLGFLKIFFELILVLCSFFSGEIIFFTCHH